MISQGRVGKDGRHRTGRLEKWQKSPRAVRADLHTHLESPVLQQITYKSDTTTTREVVPQVEKAPVEASSPSAAAPLVALPSTRAVAAAAPAVWARMLACPRSSPLSSVLVSCFSSSSFSSVWPRGDDEDGAGCLVFFDRSSLTGRGVAGR